MKVRLDLCRFLGVISKTSVVVLAMMVFTSSRALAQKKDAGAGEIKQSTYGALAEAPAEARERENPFEGNPRAVAVGRKLFEQHCSECHGKTAAGTRKAPSLLRDEVQQAPPGALFWILTNGVVRQGMPVWSKLPEQQRWQLVTFLRSLHTPSESSRPSRFLPCPLEQLSISGIMRSYLIRKIPRRVLEVSWAENSLLS